MEKNGFAFATIHKSGNYFIVYNGKVYYSDHDGGEDNVWGETIEAFFEKALSDPAQFLYNAGCYTRCFKEKSEEQYIPEEYLHDDLV